MKKAICLLLMACSLIATLSISKTIASDNLITNASAETIGTNGLPTGWQTGKWGTNMATFSIENSGQDGSNSLMVNMTQFTSGDAKWYFSPVSVSPNTSYTFSEYSKSSVTTDVDLQIINSSGTEKYKWLGQVTSSSDWKLTTLQFTTPADASKITIFHSISAVGFLQTDNFRLESAVGPVVTNGVPNGSLEQNSGTPAQPVNWHSATWQNNTAIFSYLNEGNIGSHSVKVEISNYTSGDSKWYFDSQKVTPGQNYVFSDYYKSNISTQATIEIEKTDGTYQYIDFSYASPATTWTKYTAGFTMPAGAAMATVFHTIAGVGYLITDDYSLTSSTSGFSRPLVSLTFDDGYKSHYSDTLPLLQKYSVNSTFFVVTNYSSFSGYMTVDQIKALKAAGNEVGSHTVGHLDLTTLPVDQIVYQLLTSKQTLESNYGPVTSFASPFGAFNNTTVEQIKKYYSCNRTTQAGYNTTANLNPYTLKVQNVRRDTPSSQVSGWLDEAIRTNSWLILVYHEIDNGTDIYGTTAAVLEANLQTIKSKNITAIPVNQALSETTSQVNK